MQHHVRAALGRDTRDPDNPSFLLPLPLLKQYRGIPLPIFVLVDGLVATRANQQKIADLIQAARIVRELSATTRPIRGKRIDAGFLRDVN
jgi:hypothetical protein